MQASPDVEVARISSLLRESIKLAGMSQREVERRLGVSGAYLSRVFSGVIELKVAHVLAISETIGLDPTEFWQIALPPRGRKSPAAGKLLSLVRRNGEGDRRPKPPPPPPSPQQVEETTRRALRSVFDELGRLCG